MPNPSGEATSPQPEGPVRYLRGRGGSSALPAILVVGWAGQPSFSGRAVEGREEAFDLGQDLRLREAARSEEPAVIGRSWSRISERCPGPWAVADDDIPRIPPAPMSSDSGS